ncbi:MAG TPA: TlyA family RNA methyltransferase [Rhizomicrobium sp.]|nr:TlyA family RNA methyltransferase [Rhizomicrobium sp.]
MRADVFLVKHGFAASRAEAQSAIDAGCVRADGVLVTKPSQLLHDSAQIDYAPAHPYVSRGALKLIAALDRFAISARGKICLDLGASTGGFTQVLLERGAARVYAIDVGRGQLHPRLAADPRVIARERLHARALSSSDIPELVDVIVADLSFISLKLALGPALNLSREGARLVALVKPQFEVGRAKIAKRGIVRDADARGAAVTDVAAWLTSLSWSVEGAIESPIAGGSGNREYLLAARRA